MVNLDLSQNANEIKKYPTGAFAAVNMCYIYCIECLTVYFVY